MTGTDQARTTRTHTTTVIAGVALVVCLIGAGVALALAGWKTEAIVGLLTGLAGVAAVLLPLLNRTINVEKETVQQTQQLGVITHQTNGVLSERIRAEVEDAVRSVWSNPPIGYHLTELGRVDPEDVGDDPLDSVA